MNIVVFGPDIHLRSIQPFALREVPVESRLPSEILVCRSMGEVHDASSGVIGIPWVNPRGRGVRISLLGEYLNDPVTLLRAIVVAFTANSGVRADSAVVLADRSLQAELNATKEWVEPRLGSCHLEKTVVWTALEDELEDLPSVVANMPASAPPELIEFATNVEMPGAGGIRALCESLTALSG